MYNHKTYRVVTACRGVLVSSIFSKTLDLSAAAASAQGSAALTLITVDTGQVCSTLATVHDLWSSLVDAGIALWLLERQLGIVCFIPGVFSIGLCYSLLSFFERTADHRDSLLLHVHILI